MSKPDVVKMTQAEEFAEQRYQDGLAKGQAQRDALLSALKQINSNARLVLDSQLGQERVVLQEIAAWAWLAIAGCEKA